MNKDINNVINQPEYGISFWNRMAAKQTCTSFLDECGLPASGGYLLPGESASIYNSHLLEESVFRNIATVMSVGKGDNKVSVYSTNTRATWPGTGSFATADMDDDFSSVTISSHRCGLLLKLTTEFAHDAQFDLKKHLLKTLAKRVGPIEDSGFITGNGQTTPTGILASTGGATTGVTASSLSYDDVISLYFSLKPEYRKSGCWLMNDNTAMTLRKLKDENGRYLWRDHDDTIFGRPVYISEFMPNATAGNKPIAFGDFSYYWVFQREPMSVKVLDEVYANNGKTGYLCHERLDGRLIRTEAVKVLAVSAG